MLLCCTHSAKMNLSLDTSRDSLQDEFCSPSKASVENCSQYLQQELRTLGLPSSFVNEKTNQPEPSQLLNIVYRLLQIYRQNLRVIEEQKEQLQRGKSDVLMQRETLSRLKEDGKRSEREIASLEDKERQLNEKIKNLTAKLRAEQEEVRRLKLNMQYKETHHSHESKKREKEYERLKQKFSQVLLDKSQERRFGMSMLNTLQRPDGKRKTWMKPGSGDEEVYRAVVSNYEERQKELMVENASLRESIAGIQKQLVSLLNEQQAKKKKMMVKSEGIESSEPADLATSPDAMAPCEAEGKILTSGHFQMPYDIVRDGIEESFRDKCRKVKEHIDELRERIEKLEKNSETLEDGDEGVGVDRDSEIEQLENKLSDYRQIIAQQEELLTSKTSQGEEEAHDVLSESHVWRERDRLELDRQMFLEQQRTFEEERLKYMEAVRKLDRERQRFEDEKAAFLREQFLDSSMLNSTREMESFFGKLSSTPPSTHHHDQHQREEMVEELSSIAKTEASQSVLQEVDLRHDLSLCSDDGMGVLNERPEIKGGSDKET